MDGAGELDKRKEVWRESHTMYDVIHHGETTHKDYAMLLEKTGTGLTALIPLSQGRLGSHATESVSVVEELKSVRDFAVASFTTKLIVSGGYDMRDNFPTNSVLLFDAGHIQWRPVSAMMRKRCNHTLVTWRGKALATGGQTTSNGTTTPTCEIYSPDSDKWKAFPSLPEARSGHACVIHKNHVYISGGYDSHGLPQRDIWTYDSTIASWKNLDADYPIALQTELVFHKMVSSYDSIYIIGGQQRNRAGETEVTDNIHSFKPRVSYIGRGAQSTDMNKLKYDRVTAWSYRHAPLVSSVHDFGCLITGDSILTFGGQGEANGNACLIQTHRIGSDISRCYELDMPLNSSKESGKLFARCDCARVTVSSRSETKEIAARDWPLW